MMRMPTILTSWTRVLRMIATTTLLLLSSSSSSSSFVNGQTTDTVTMYTMKFALEFGLFDSYADYSAVDVLEEDVTKLVANVTSFYTKYLKLYPDTSDLDTFEATLLCRTTNLTHPKYKLMFGLQGNFEFPSDTTINANYGQLQQAMKEAKKDMYKDFIKNYTWPIHPNPNDGLLYHVKLVKLTGNTNDKGCLGDLDSTTATTGSSGTTGSGANTASKAVASTSSSSTTTTTNPTAFEEEYETTLPTREQAQKEGAAASQVFESSAAGQLLSSAAAAGVAATTAKSYNSVTTMAMTMASVASAGTFLW